MGYQTGGNWQPKVRRILLCAWWEPGHQNHRKFAVKAGGRPLGLALIKSLLCLRVHLARSLCWICLSPVCSGIPLPQQMKCLSCHVTSGKKIRDSQQIPSAWPAVTPATTSSQKTCAERTSQVKISCLLLLSL